MAKQCYVCKKWIREGSGIRPSKYGHHVHNHCKDKYIEIMKHKHSGKY